MSDITDIALLVALVFMDCIYYAYGMTLPYHTSYIKQDHPTYSNALIYSTLLSMEVGLLLVNLVLPYLEKRVGILNVIRMCGVLVMLAMVLFIYYTDIFSVFAGYFLIGTTHQITVFSVVFVLTVKHRQSLVKYVGIVFSATPLSMLFWGVLTKLIINPNNVGQTSWHAIEDGSVERYFPAEVTGNFPLFCWLYGFLNLGLAFVVSLFIKVDSASVRSYREENPAVVGDLPFTNCEEFKVSVYSRQFVEVQKLYYQLEFAKSNAHQGPVSTKTSRSTKAARSWNSQTRSSEPSLSGIGRTIRVRAISTSRASPTETGSNCYRRQARMCGL